MTGITFKGDRILRRTCPTSPMHWRVDEPNGRCPACKAKIVETAYVSLDAVVEALRDEERSQVGFVNVEWAAKFLEREFGGDV